jgi:hypothetical protein
MEAVAAAAEGGGEGGAVEEAEEGERDDGRGEEPGERAPAQHAAASPALRRRLLHRPFSLYRAGGEVGWGSRLTSRARARGWEEKRGEQRVGGGRVAAAAPAGGSGVGCDCVMTSPGPWSGVDRRIGRVPMFVGITAAEEFGRLSRLLHVTSTRVSDPQGYPGAPGAGFLGLWSARPARRLPRASRRDGLRNAAVTAVSRMHFSSLV